MVVEEVRNKRGQLAVKTVFLNKNPESPGSLAASGIRPRERAPDPGGTGSIGPAAAAEVKPLVTFPERDRTARFAHVTDKCLPSQIAVGATYGR